jgi:hypothetical protein
MFQHQNLLQGITYENQECQIPSVGVRWDRLAQSIPLPVARVAIGQASNGNFGTACCSIQFVCLNALGSLVSRTAEQQFLVKCRTMCSFY